MEEAVSHKAAGSFPLFSLLTTLFAIYFFPLETNFTCHTLKKAVLPDFAFFHIKPQSTRENLELNPRCKLHFRLLSSLAISRCDQSLHYIHRLKGGHFFWRKRKVRVIKKQKKIIYLFSKRSIIFRLDETSRKLARPRLNAPPHPTPSDCALFVLFCAIVINICACMVTFLFYIFLGPANFTPTYAHKDILLTLFVKSLDLFCAYLCRPPRRRYSRRSRERRCFVGRPTSRLPTHSSKLSLD